MRFESEESIFNMAVAYLQRIDKLLYQSQEVAAQDNIDSWLRVLRAIERELCVKLKPDEDKELSNMFVSFNELLTPTNRLKHKGLLLMHLHNIDKYMRRKLQQRGMLLPNKADIHAAIFEK